MDESVTQPICLSCKHAIFDQKWGEYKCRVREIYIYDAFVKLECPHYEKAKEEKK